MGPTTRRLVKNAQKHEQKVHRFDMTSEAADGLLVDNEDSLFSSTEKSRR